jgi:hypothetical protein
MNGSKESASIVDLHPELEEPVTRSLKCKHQGNQFNNKTGKIIVTGLGLLWRSVMSLKSLHPEVRILEGTEKYSGEPLSVIYVGTSNDFEFISGCLFSSVEICRTDAPWWVIFNIRKWADRHQSNVDLIVVDIGYPLGGLIRQDGSLRIPRWIKQRVKLSDNWHEILEGMSRKRRREASR